jgi:hypothetical protein
MAKKISSSGPKSVEEFLLGKTDYSQTLFHYFIDEYKKIGSVAVLPAKTMIGIATPAKRIAWVTQFGKSFIHVVFPLKKPYHDNLYFQKIAQVPGQQQFNHHFRMLVKEDINGEVKKFMKLALAEASVKD